jgi:peptidoglycan/xylan/chitin deacetylase (PgdA/CDA1 family)
VAITIDDGWRSFYEIGLPILKKYGIPATLFVYTDFIGGSKAMTWNQVKDVAESGIDIQCHTRTHRNLTVLREKESLKEYLAAVEAEIVTSQKEIKSRLNRECRYLAYPYGKTNSLVISMLQKHGYRAGFTVSREANAFFNDQYRIGRAVIYGTYDMDRFKRNLSVFHPMVLK